MKIEIRKSEVNWYFLGAFAPLCENVFCSTALQILGVGCPKWFCCSAVRVGRKLMAILTGCLKRCLKIE